MNLANTSRQLAGEAAASQSEFLRLKRQEVYAQFVASASELQYRFKGFKMKFADQPIPPEAAASLQNDLLRLRQELELGRSGVRLLGSAGTTSAASEVVEHFDQVLTRMPEFAAEIANPRAIGGGPVIANGRVLDECEPATVFETDLFISTCLGRSIEEFVQQGRKDLAITTS